MVFQENVGNRVAKQAAQLTNWDRSWYSILSHEADSLDETHKLGLNYCVGNLAMLLASAERARKASDSWRGFKVGAAAVAYYFSRESTTYRYNLLHGANVKPAEDGEVNVHAEQVIMGKTILNTDNGEEATIPLLAVVGDLQPDQQTTISSPTLHPCGVCREAFCENASPISPGTLIISASPDMRDIEWYTVDSLQGFHDKRDESGMGHVHFDEPPLALTYDHELMASGGVVRMDKFEGQDFVDSNRLVTSELVIPVINHILRT